MNYAEQKGMTSEKAAELISDVLYFGVMMVKSRGADGHGRRRMPRHGRRAAPLPPNPQDRAGVKLVNSFSSWWYRTAPLR